MSLMSNLRLPNQPHFLGNDKKTEVNSNSDLANKLSKSANPSVESLQLLEELKKNPAAFTDRYLTKNGEGKELTNTGEAIFKMDVTASDHVQQARKLAETSKLVKVINMIGGKGPNIFLKIRVGQIGQNMAKNLKDFSKNLKDPSK